MKTIILKGVEIKKGSKVRFINDKDLYTGIEGIIKPEIGGIYTVRDINEKGGFLLKEIINDDFEWYLPSGELDIVAEPGFASRRFEPQLPLRKKVKVNIEILPEVKETLYIPPTKKKVVKRDLETV